MNTIVSEDHDLYDETMSQWPEYLEKRKPEQWMVEQIDAFDSVSARTGISYLDTFCQLCSAKGYKVGYIRLDNATWIAMPRLRHYYYYYDHLTVRLKDCLTVRLFDCRLRDCLTVVCTTTGQDWTMV